MRERLLELYFNYFNTRDLSFHWLCYFFLFCTGKTDVTAQMMFTVKNFYDKVEASYEFTYTEN